MFWPAVTLAGPGFVTDTSASVTVVVTSAALFSSFGSGVDEAIEAVFENSVPDGVSAGTWPVSVKVVVPGAKLASVHCTVPPAPSAGVVHEKAWPADCTSDTNVIVPGSVSVKVAPAAASGPPLLTVIV